MTTSATRQNVPTGPRSTTIRWLAVLGVTAGLLQLLGGILETVDRVGPGETGYALRTSLMGLIYLLFLAPLLGIARTGLPRTARVPRLGLATAGGGWVLYAAAQFALQVDFDLAERLLFPIGTILIGAGMIVSGVAVIRAHRWTGWRGFLPLMCGLYPFVLIFPTFAVTGGPNFLVLSGWGFCWLVLGLALYPHRADA